MSILRWKIVNRLREIGNVVNVTYGYITKSARIALKLAKSHANDAFCIAGGQLQERTDVLNGTFNRRNNRSIQLNRKGFAPSVRRKRYPLQPNDIVRYGKFALRVVGTHSYGKVVRLRDEFKNKIDINIKKAKLLTFGKGLRFA